MVVTRRLRVCVLFVALVALGPTALAACSGSAHNAQSTTTTAKERPVDGQPAFPIRAAFYYPWFPEAWTQQGLHPFSHYTPTLGLYNSSDKTTVATHVAAMRAAGLDAGIASWWGPHTPTDGRIATLLSAASSTPFRWALYYEKEGVSDPTVGEIHADLAYIAVHYANAPSFLHVDGRPVVFVYASPTDGCAMADRYARANAQHEFYIVLKVFSHFRTCASQPDSWHQYEPAIAAAREKGFSYTISPGFWKFGEAAPRLARDPSRWATDVQRMVASGVPWQLVTTFNEWGEGTAIESSTEWNTTYLDVLAKYLPRR